MTSESWTKWIPVADRLVFQAYYRVMSFVSMHAPVSEVYKAIQYVAETKRGGTVYWVVEPFVAKWEDVSVAPGITTTLWVFGREKNTVYARVGWWKLYLVNEATRRVASVLGTWRPGPSPTTKTLSVSPQLRVRG